MKEVSAGIWETAFQSVNNLVIVYAFGRTFYDVLSNVITTTTVFWFLLFGLWFIERRIKMIEARTQGVRQGDLVIVSGHVKKITNHKGGSTLKIQE